MKHIPTLDGWRGIAIALVLFDHIQYALLHRYMRPWTQTGQHGVTIFFVLSGFLITSKLIEGPIDLKSFYLRRFFRLMPVAWTYLAAILVIQFLSHSTIGPPFPMLASLFFFRNYVVGTGGEATRHFWSLSLEEQFYLIWPSILILAGIHRSRWIAAFGAILCASYRWASWTLYDREIYNYQSQVRADAVLVGCLLALLLQMPRIRSKAFHWSKLWGFPASAILLYCIIAFQLLPPLAESISIALLIAASVLHSTSIFAWPLRLRTVSQLGVMSYSLYVWQALFLQLTPVNLYAGIFLLFVALPLFAFMSYEYMELPFTKLGRRLTEKPG